VIVDVKAENVDDDLLLLLILLLFGVFCVVNELSIN
jgi:hypothetical protein